MTDDPEDQHLRRRIQATAILTGHRGLGEFAQALGTPGLSHGSLRAIRRDVPGFASKMATISAYASSVGVAVPVGWLMEGFGPVDGDAAAPDRPAMMSDLAALEARIKEGS